MEQDLQKEDSGKSNIYLLLVRESKPIRRLRALSKSLRTSINIESLFYNNIENITLNDIEEIKVVAPYFYKSKSYAYFMVGLSFGLYISYFLSKFSLVPFSFVAIIFACVSFMIGSHFDSAMRLAQIKMKDGKHHMIAYKKEEEHQVRCFFKEIRWIDEGSPSEDTRLLKSEIIHLEKIRIGLTIVAGSLSVIIMTVLSDYLPRETPDEIDIPLSIIYITVFTFSILFSIAGFFRLYKIYKNS